MKKSKRKRLTWIAISGVLFVSLAYWTLGSGPSQKPVLETATVEFGDLTVELPATGQIDAINVVDVGSPISGRIQSIHADFNGRVKAGQLLAEIEDDDYRATFLQAQADWKAAQAAIEVAEANVRAAIDDQGRAKAYSQRSQAMFENAKADLDRNKKLLADGIVNQSVFDRIETAYLTAKADLASMAAQVLQAESKVKNARGLLDEARATADQRAARAAVAKRNLDYCRVLSPVTGIVVSRNVDVGQTIAARLSAPSLFHIAEDLSRMYVYTKLDSSDVAKVQPGLKATFTVNAYPGETFEGTLVEVRINPNPESPVSRAQGTQGQFKRSISAGVSSAGTSASEQQSAGGSTSGGASGASSGGGSPGGASGSSGGQSQSPSSSGGLPQTATGTTAGAAPPTSNRNTVVVYDTLIEFANPDQKLLPGMTAYVTIPLRTVKDTLKVPAAALRFSPNLAEPEKQRLLESGGIRAGEPVVWVVTGEKQNPFRPARVKPVLTDYVLTAVESADLKPGMKVATQLNMPAKTPS